MGNNIILETKFVADIRGSFYIPSYQRGYRWSETDDDHLSRDEMGQYLVYDDVYIDCENNSYGVYRNDDDSLTDTVTISQNEAGIDTEDRIIKLKKYIANMK